MSKSNLRRFPGTGARHYEWHAVSDENIIIEYNKLIMYNTDRCARNNAVMIYNNSFPTRHGSLVVKGILVSHNSES